MSLISEKRPIEAADAYNSLNKRPTKAEFSNSFKNYGQDRPRGINFWKKSYKFDDC